MISLIPIHAFLSSHASCRPPFSRIGQLATAEKENESHLSMMRRRNRLRFYKHPSPTSAPPNRRPMGRRLHGEGFEKLFVSFVVLVAVYDTRSLAGRGVQAAASSSSDVDISLSLCLSVCFSVCRCGNPPLSSPSGSTPHYRLSCRQFGPTLSYTCFFSSMPPVSPRVCLLLPLSLILSQACLAHHHDRP